MTRCEICNKGPMDGVTVFRVNEKGGSPVWRCQEHANEVADDLLQLTKELERQNDHR